MADEDAERPGEPGSRTACRVLVADDTASLRTMLRIAISKAEGLELVGEAEDGGQAVEMIGALQPDVVVLDLGLPGVNGLDVIPEITRLSPHTRTLVLSGHDESEMGPQALSRGAARYLVKGTPLRDVVAAIRENCGGRA